MKNLILLVLMLIGTATFGQQRMLTGKVIDQDGLPLIGVNIQIKDTSQGTITNIDGNYTLQVPGEDAMVVFSYTGYEPQEIALNGRTVLDVTLAEAVTLLDEIVVVGYGEVKKRDLTGSVSKVTERDDVARQYNTIDALLQGRAAGVQVSSNAGAPGSAISVRIRGTNSLRGNNEPLYVIDGIIINSAAEDVRDASTDANELQTDQNGLVGLNPRDIESIEILKDASATAIYGSRGANGVVLITTKQGKEGRAKIDAYFTTEISQVAKSIDLLGPIGYANFRNEGADVEGLNRPYEVQGNQVFPVTYEDDPNTGEPIPTVGTVPLEQINWQDQIYQDGISRNMGFSASGSTENSKYYFSAGFNDINGIVETTNIKRGDVRLNWRQDLSPKFTLDNRISLMYQTGSFAQAGSKSGGNRSFTKQILTYRPLVGQDEENSDDLDLEISNPYAWLTDYDDETEEVRANISTSLNYQIIKGLKYQLRGGLDFRTKERARWYDLGVFKGGQVNGDAIYSNLRRYSYVIDNLLTYNKRIKRIHNLNATAGVTYNGNNIKSDVYEITDFPIKILRADAAQLGQIVERPYGLIFEDEAIFSALARVNYTFKDKYILTASFRADQSSKFSKDNQWGYFPSAAFAWRISEEPFIKDLDLFYNLKLRFGWGQTGNQAINPYQTLATYFTNYYVDAAGNTIIGNSPARIPNPDLTWETTNQFNAGLDLSFFDGKLNTTIDAYYKTTVDLLQQIQLGPSNGYQSMTINRGEIENKGLELTVDALVLNRSDLSINVGGRIAFNRNKVLELGLAPNSIWVDGQELEEVYYLGNNISTGTYFKAPANIFMEGQPIGMFWGYETNGVYQTQEAADVGPTYQGTPNQAGDLIYIDHNGDGNINDADRTFIGNPNPDFTYGFDFSVNYKRLNLKVLFDGVYGNDIANGYNTELAFAESNSKNVLQDAYDQAWRPDAPSNLYPRIGYAFNRTFPDVIVEDGSFLRLNIVTLGYDLPIPANKVIKNLNVYVSGRNLFYLTDYSGYEPQVNSFLFDGTIMGVDWIGTPNVRTFLVGVNASF